MSGPSEGFKSALPFWILKRGIAREEGETGDLVQIPTWLWEGLLLWSFSFIPHLWTHTRLFWWKDAWERKLDFWVGIPDLHNIIFLSGLGHHCKNWVPTCVESGLKSCPRRTKWPQEQAVWLTRQVVEQTSDLLTSHIYNLECWQCLPPDEQAALLSYQQNPSLLFPLEPKVLLWGLLPILHLKVTQSRLLALALFVPVVQKVLLPHPCLSKAYPPSKLIVNVTSSIKLKMIPLVKW